MSTISFLLAPLREIPTEYDDQWMSTVQSWLHIANFAWFGLWQQLTEEQRRGVPKMPPGTGLSSNAMDATRKKDPEIMASAKGWAERVWRAWNDSGRQAPLPVADSATTHEALGLDSHMTITQLIGYAGGFTPIAPAKLKRGGRYGFLKSEGDINAFAFGERDSTQRELFLEIARGHGGDHLAVWTFGHSLHVLVARSAKPGARPTVQGPFSVRARVLDGSKRPGGFVEAVMAALEGSAFRPDFETLQRELAKPELSVAKCFEAFGVPGARDFASPDVAARWEDMNCVGHALLTGQPVDKKQLKNLNDLLEPLDSSKLPSKAKLGTGATAREVATAIVELRDALGVPESGVWAERFRSAAWYWDICDGEALDRLTAGTDRAGLGTSASLARLLAHFPKELLRDPVYLALLALECEAANGHVYVEGLFKLAEQTATAGLALVVASRNQHLAMRKVFGIDPESDGSNPVTTHCGEALVSGTTVAKGDVPEFAQAWMTKSKATGVVAELPPEGNIKLTWFKEGAPAKDAQSAGLGKVDHAALRHAAERFLPREGFVALGAGDLLAPGEWQQGSYGGESAPAGEEDHRIKKRRRANTLLDAAAERKSLSHPSELLTVLGPHLQYSGPLSEVDGGIVSLRVAPPAPDAVWLRDLRNDLKGDSVISRYGEAWVQNGEIRGYSCSSLDVALLVQLLGDAPSGTVVGAGQGTDLLGAWRVS
jgi:hypothetical protein